MPLAVGTRLGPFEVLAQLGEGGMGEVYRARDTTLNREVAIKVLPESFASNPDRLARFQREAQVLASLDHPNIAHIHGVEQSASVRALIMELVQGEDLAQRIARGAIPLDEALPIARQIAGALEAAHDQGIIHRDLKPANIKVTPAGQVKVLDFGLAKISEGSRPPESLTKSPTVSPQSTNAGVILGTAAYMSPEQARGKPVDRRTDVWAFGCVLFEMLTGAQTFPAGDSISDTIAAILTSEPNWQGLPADTPVPVRGLLKRCLQKDPHERLPHISVARLEIDEGSRQIAEPLRNSAAPSSVVAPVQPWWKRAVPLAAIVMLASGLSGAAVWDLRPPRASLSSVTRFSMTLGEGQAFPGLRSVLAVSPDGASLVYAANNQLYLRSMADLEARPIPGTQESQPLSNPVFSPDGRSIAFYAGAVGEPGILKSVAASGGAAFTICSAARSPLGMSWDADGILFGQGSDGIMRVSARGGQPSQIIAVNDDEVAHGPQMLADGQTVLFTLATGAGPDRWDKAKIVVQSLRSGARTVVVDGGSDARYLPSGHMVYAVGGVLFALPFDLGRLQPSAAAVPVVEGVRRTIGGAAATFTAATGAAQYAVADNGSLFYVPGPVSPAYLNAGTDLALIDRKGGVEGLKFPVGTYVYPRVSPDGKRLAFATDDSKESIIWVYDLSGTSSMRRLTFDSRNRFPIWSSDSRHVAFQSDRDGDAGIFWQLADGTGVAERLTKPDPGTSHVPESWEPGGDRFLFSVVRGPMVSLWVYSLRDRKALPFGGVRSANLTNAAFSPDGRWVAYASAITSGSASDSAVYVQPFPATGARYQVSKDGDQGHDPLWSRDSKDLFYIPLPTQLAVVTMTTQPTVGFSKPVAVERRFGGAGPTTPRPFDVTPNGRIIAPLDTTQTQAGPHIQAVLNWFEELKQRAPTR